MDHILDGVCFRVLQLSDHSGQFSPDYPITITHLNSMWLTHIFEWMFLVQNQQPMYLFDTLVDNWGKVLTFT